MSCLHGRMPTVVILSGSITTDKMDVDEESTFILNYVSTDKLEEDIASSGVEHLNPDSAGSGHLRRR